MEKDSLTRWFEGMEQRLRDRHRKEVDFSGRFIRPDGSYDITGLVDAYRRAVDLLEGSPSDNVDFYVTSMGVLANLLEDAGYDVRSISFEG